MKFSVISACFQQLSYLMENKKYWDAQTFKDFELILADDGSDDGSWAWAKENKIKIVGNWDHRFDYDWTIHNKAANCATGDYLVWVMGDSYPKEDFLEQINKLISPERVVNGMRINVDDRGNFISPDWRNKGIGDEVTALRVDWGNMTLNSMVMSRKVFNKIGGFYKGYKGYGRADIELVIRAKLLKVEMWVAPKAIVYHRVHKSAPENPENVALFEKRTGRLII